MFVCTITLVLVISNFSALSFPHFHCFVVRFLAFVSSFVFCVLQCLQICIAGASALFAYWLVSGNNGGSGGRDNFGTWFIMAFAAFMGWLIATIFFELYSTIVDAVALCFMEDKKYAVQSTSCFCSSFYFALAPSLSSLALSRALSLSLSSFFTLSFLLSRCVFVLACFVCISWHPALLFSISLWALVLPRSILIRSFPPRSSICACACACVCVCVCV